MSVTTGAAAAGATAPRNGGCASITCSRCGHPTTGPVYRHKGYTHCLDCFVARRQHIDRYFFERYGCERWRCRFAWDAALATSDRWVPVPGERSSGPVDTSRTDAGIRDAAKRK